MNSNYETARVAVDAVIFTIHNKKLKVFLHTREKEPFQNKKELPGGLLISNETAEKALSRKIKEILDIDKLYFEQFFTFTEPQRDPRIRTISIGFIALIDSQKIKDFSNWFDYKSVKEFAFDHKAIIEKAVKYLKKEINSIIAMQFIPSVFPLNMLQEVYEIIENKKYDNRNFRRKVLNEGVVIETEKIERDVSHRPAKLYKFKIDKTIS
ncbi:MAG: NUDIX domain-containing protein [archaeon]